MNQKEFGKNYLVVIKQVVLNRNNPKILMECFDLDSFKTGSVYQNLGCVLVCLVSKGLWVSFKEDIRHLLYNYQSSIPWSWLFQ